MQVIAITFLSIAFALQLLLPKTRLNKLGFLLFAVSLFSVFGFSFFQSWQQYQLWKNDPAAQFLLPPYQTWDYFIYYARYHFFNPYLISLLIGFIFFFSSRKLNHKYQERFFEPIEPYLLLISLFLSGTPGWAAYLFVFFAVYFLCNMFITSYHLFFTKQRNIRISLFYLWLPSAISTILISRWLSALPLWQMLKF